MYAKLVLINSYRIYRRSEHEVEFQMYKLPGNNQIPAELIKARDMTLALRSTNLVILIGMRKKLADPSGRAV